MKHRSTLFVLAFALAGCPPQGSDLTDTDPSTSTDTETETDSDTETETDPPRNQAQRCSHGGYLDAWFPRSFTRLQKVDGEEVEEWPFPRYDEKKYPNWRIIEETSLELSWYGDGAGSIVHGTVGQVTSKEADLKDMPETQGFREPVELTQDGDKLLVRGATFRFDCVRRVRPTNPVHPVQQEDLWCVDQDGQQSLWLAVEWFQDDAIRVECLAEHVPPSMPTRWSLMERTDDEGTTVYPHWRDSLDKPYATEVDIAMSSSSKATYTQQVTSYDPDTEWLGWPERTAREVTWHEVGPGHWQLQVADGPLMDCLQDDDIGELGDEYRTFALACEDESNVLTWWVPVDMTYPWGWGSHDTPGGWWYEAGR